MVPRSLDLIDTSLVLALRRRKRNSHYYDVKNGYCTRGVKTGARTVAWPRHEIDQLNAARVAGCTDSEIRQLVKELEAARKEFAPSTENST